MFDSLRYARRQAYRYGRQITLMNDSNIGSFNKHIAAWNDFLAQFSTLDECDVIIAHLIAAFQRGQNGDDASDIANGFIIVS